MKYLKKFKSINEDIKNKPKGVLNKVISSLNSRVKKEWRSIEKSDLPEYLSEFEKLLGELHENQIKDDSFLRDIYDISLRYPNLKECITEITKYINNTDYIDEHSISRFKGKNKIFESNGYVLFKIDNFKEIEGFAKASAICYKEEYFDMYNKHDIIHFLFKDGIFIYAFSINRETSLLGVISNVINNIYKIENIKDIDLGAYKIMKSSEKLYSSRYDVMKKINNL